MESGETGIGLWNGATWQPQNIPNAGTDWHHVAFVFNMTSSNTPTTTIYWDGVAVGQTDQALGFDPETTQLGSSSRTQTEGWIGTLDEVAFYGSALASDSIQAHYAAFFGGAPPVITAQPVGGAFYTSQPLTLTVGASGAAKISNGSRTAACSPERLIRRSALPAWRPLSASRLTLRFPTRPAAPPASTPTWKWATTCPTTRRPCSRKPVSSPTTRSMPATRVTPKAPTTARRWARWPTPRHQQHRAMPGLRRTAPTTSELGEVAAFEFTDGTGTVETWLRMRMVAEQRQH